jgi:hypothetical protein
MHPSELPIVKRGYWMYAGTQRAEIRIVAGTLLYGSGDDEDPPEIANDEQVACYYVAYESPPGSGCFPAGGGRFRSIDEAVATVERTIAGPITWY